MHGDRRRTIGLAVAAAALIVVLLPGSAASAAPPHPTPTRPAATSTATLTVAGLEDSCPVSTGRSTVRIKPGDKIVFRTSVAGVDRSRLATAAGPGSGLNVSATVDGGRRFAVSGGRSHSVAGLSRGAHVLRWTVTGVQVSTVHGQRTVPLSRRALQDGAKLSWTGQILVSSAAPCAGLGAPRIELASQDASSPSQLPVLFAILAVIALVMVAGLYARIYLLHRKPSA